MVYPRSPFFLGVLVTCRGVRGAISVESNTPEAIRAAARELLERLVVLNGIRPEDLAAVFFTSTPDLDAAFSAQAARELGWAQVPLLGAQEVAVPDAPPRTIRLLLLWNTDVPPQRIRHLYLGQAAQLRPEWEG